MKAAEIALIIIVIIIAYLPTIYRMQRRIRILEDEVRELKKSDKSG
ncbi:MULTISPECIES: hypothetical protein [unclassified Virgibacillus]|nr:hypothetical protein [Virgibacillus sp. LDC-1]